MVKKRNKKLLVGAAVAVGAAAAFMKSAEARTAVTEKVKKKPVIPPEPEPSVEPPSTAIVMPNNYEQGTTPTTPTPPLQPGPEVPTSPKDVSAGERQQDALNRENALAAARKVHAKALSEIELIDRSCKHAHEVFKSSRTLEEKLKLLDAFVRRIPPMVKSFGAYADENTNALKGFFDEQTRQTIANDRQSVRNTADKCVNIINLEYISAVHGAAAIALGKKYVSLLKAVGPKNLTDEQYKNQLLKFKAEFEEKVQPHADFSFLTPKEKTAVRDQQLKVENTFTDLVAAKRATKEAKAKLIINSNSLVRVAQTGQKNAQNLQTTIENMIDAHQAPPRASLLAMQAEINAMRTEFEERAGLRAEQRQKANLAKVKGATMAEFSQMLDGVTADSKYSTTISLAQAAFNKLQNGIHDKAKLVASINSMGSQMGWSKTAQANFSKQYMGKNYATVLYKFDMVKKDYGAFLKQKEQGPRAMADYRKAVLAFYSLTPNRSRKPRDLDKQIAGMARYPVDVIQKKTADFNKAIADTMKIMDANKGVASIMRKKSGLELEFQRFMSKRVPLAEIGAATNYLAQRGQGRFKSTLSGGVQYTWVPDSRSMVGTFANKKYSVDKVKLIATDVTRKAQSRGYRFQQKLPSSVYEYKASLQGDVQSFQRRIAAYQSEINKLNAGGKTIVAVNLGSGGAKPLAPVAPPPQKVPPAPKPQVKTVSAKEQAMTDYKKAYHGYFWTKYGANGLPANRFDVFKRVEAQSVNFIQSKTRQLRDWTADLKRARG